MPDTAPPPDKADDAALIREWLQVVMQRTGLRPTPLAKKAGLAPSTLLHALDENNPTTLERRSIRKLADFAGIEPPAPNAAGQPSLPVTDGDLADEGNSDAQPPGRYRRTVVTRALMQIGIMPGDKITFEQRLAGSGDVVHAEEERHGNTRTLPHTKKIRIYNFFVA